MEKNTEAISQYNGNIGELENFVTKVENDPILDRKQRNKLIEYLDSTINHCKGKIRFLNGSYVPSQNYRGRRF